VKENASENADVKTIWWNRGWIFILFLVTATLMAYLPVWHAGFVWDDDILLTANPLIKDPHGWYRFWFTTKTPDYFPVMSSAFWLEWRLWGMNAAGYHVVNVLLHAANAILLWRLLLRLEIPGAKLAAAIFALHPVNVESVAWIAELKNTLSLFFFVLSLLAYLKFDDTNRRQFYWLAFAAFLFSLLSKIEVAPLPFVLLGIAWWRRNQIEWKDIWRMIPFFAAAFLLGLVSIWFQNHVAIGHDIVRTDSFWSRLASAGWAVWFYFYKTFLPINLMPIYPRWHIDAANALSYVPGLLLVGGFLVCWQFRKKWGKPFLFGLGYAVMMFLPILGFLNIYFFRFTFVSNHWQYFSIIAPIALASAGLTIAAKHFHWKKSALAAVVAVLLLVLGALTWQQAAIYKNPETLWSATLAENPNCFIAHNNLGLVFLQRGQIDGAVGHFEQAVLLQPDDESSQKNLGSAFLQKGQVDDAIAQFQKALELKPNDVGAHSDLGLAFFRKGQIDSAIAEYQKALKIQPDDTAVHHNFGIALFKEGLVDEAMAHYRKVLELQPDNAEVENDLGSALNKKGQVAGAIQHWQKSLELRPQYMPAQNNLAWALATNPDASLRNGAKAVQLAQQANQSTGGKNLLILQTLAAAYAEAGQFTDALATAGQALQLAVAEHNVPMINSLQAQMKLYESGQPLRAPAD
jgi:Flp pilus assembly protein TadD